MDIVGFQKVSSALKSVESLGAIEVEQPTERESDLERIGVVLHFVPRTASYLAERSYLAGKELTPSFIVQQALGEADLLVDNSAERVKQASGPKPRLEWRNAVAAPDNQSLRIEFVDITVSPDIIAKQ